MKHLNRIGCLEQLKKEKNSENIKLIRGIYGSGKSHLIYRFTEEVLAEDPDAHIIYIDCSLSRYEGLKDHKKLYEHVSEEYKKESVNYLFIDEVQLCPQFYFAVNELYKNGKYDIYLISSVDIRAEIEEGEFPSEKISSIDLYPLSFKEYCDLNEDFKDVDILFEWYLKNGGFIGTYGFENEHDRLCAVQNIYSKITGYGLNSSYHVQDNNILEKIQKYLIDNISRPSSPNKISDNLKSRGLSANHVTTGRYIRYLIRSFIFYELKRYDIKNQTVLETMMKYYLADLSIMDRSLVRCNPVREQLYENMIFIELKRRGYEVYSGKLYQKEIDFLALKGDEKIYIQVSEADDEKIKENIKILVQIKDAYPKFVVTRNRSAACIKDGIRVIDIAQWLYGDTIYN